MSFNRAQYIQHLIESMIDSALSGLAPLAKAAVGTAKYATGIGTDPGAPTLLNDLRPDRGFSFSPPAKIPAPPPPFRR